MALGPEGSGCPKRLIIGCTIVLTVVVLYSGGLYAIGPVTPPKTQGSPQVAVALTPKAKLERSVEREEQTIQREEQSTLSGALASDARALPADAGNVADGTLARRDGESSTAATEIVANVAKPAFSDGALHRGIEDSVADTSKTAGVVSESQVAGVGSRSVAQVMPQKTPPPKLNELVVRPSGDFERDLAERIKRFEERCRGPDPLSSFAGIWSDEDISQLCGGTVVMSNFFNSKPRYQSVSGWGTQERVSKGGTPIANLKEPDRFKFMQKWYDSIRSHNLCAIIFHDSSDADWYTRERGTERIRFVRVDPRKYDKLFQREFGLNDVRCFFMHEAVCANAGWAWIYYNDIFDVTLGRSPVGETQAATIYAGTDNGPISDPWLEETFRDLGGPYREYWKTDLRKRKKPMWSAGLLGGDRPTMLRFLARYLAVLSDPGIAMNQKGAVTPRSSWGFQQVNMPALNYVLERFFERHSHGGAPFNSKYRKFEKDRTDVWFVHK